MDPALSSVFGLATRLPVCILSLEPSRDNSVAGHGNIPVRLAAHPPAAHRGTLQPKDLL